VARPRVVVLIGPPCSGKSTHVSQHRGDGDVVLDTDHIASVLAGRSEVVHDHPEHILRLAAAAHYRARRLAVRADGDHAVWIIHADPSAHQEAEYRRFGYEVMVFDPGRDVVEARCRTERPEKALKWVAEWYERRA
jgi:predicted kinase